MSDPQSPSPSLPPPSDPALPLSPSASSAFTPVAGSAAVNTRPPYSYASLVAQALHAKEKATLQEIYAWISATYPHHYKADDPWWQPSIRYNLSLHKCFNKIVKAEPGQKGALWYYTETPAYFFDKGTLCKRRVLDDPARLTEEYFRQSQGQAAEDPQQVKVEADESPVKVEDQEGETKKARKKRKAPNTEEAGGATPPKEPRMEKLTGDDSLKETPLQTLATLEASSERMDLDGLEEEEIDIGGHLDKELASLRQKEAPKTEGSEAAANAAEGSGATPQPKDASLPLPGKFSIARALGHAIENSPEKKLTLAALYAWFLERFPGYVASNENTWKGAIRHNLSYHPMFVKLPRTESEGGKGCYWGLGEGGINTPSPSRARRPKYMNELGKPKEEDSQNTSMDTTLDTEVSRESAPSTQQLLQSMSAAEQQREEGISTLDTLAGESGAATEELPASLSAPGKRDVASKKKRGKGLAPLGEEGDLAKPKAIAEVVEEDSDVLAADPEAEPHGTLEYPSEVNQVMKAYLTNPKVKPPFSYMHLIGQAILTQEGERASLSDIIAYIMKTYPYFKEKNDPWDNSIRSLLASKPCFVKVGKPEGGSGKGHYWGIDPAWSHVLNKVSVFKGGKVFLRGKREKSDPIEEQKSDIPLIGDLFEEHSKPPVTVDSQQTTASQPSEGKGNLALLSESLEGTAKQPAKPETRADDEIGEEKDFDQLGDFASEGNN